MILSIETKGPQIEELKRQAAIPEDGIETVELPWGKALGFWGEMTQDSAELVVLLELNAAMMNREEQHRSVGHPIEASVHAHAYSSNSTMAVALEKLFKLGAQASEEKPSTAIDLKFQLTAVEQTYPGKPGSLSARAGASSACCKRFREYGRRAQLPGCRVDGEDDIGAGSARTPDLVLTALDADPCTAPWGSSHHRDFASE
ncbi:MAG: hypothetical protein U0176_26215 [Bacteroidia bacterium]